MTTLLTYNGTASQYFEVAVTGKQRSWGKGQTQSISDADAVLLMATGLFSVQAYPASPAAFASRALAETDNGQTRICASGQVATVNAGMPAGFGVAFKGAISFTAGSGVSITDVRTTGAANPWCALVQTGVDTYDVVGTKA